MNSHVFCRTLCAAILIAAASAATSPAAQLDPDEPIDIELKRASLVETLQSFAGIKGSRLDIDPEIEGAVTIAFDSTPWRRVLDRICTDHQLNCELLSGEPPVLRVRSAFHAEGAARQAGYAQAIDMSLRKADLRQTLQAFGNIGGIEVIVDDAVSGSLTIDIKNAPWTVMLEEACNLSGCRIEWGASALHILPADPALTAHRRAPLSFDRVPVTEALVTIAEMPIFGALGRPELTLADDLEGTIGLELGDVNWLEALNAVCRSAACRWQLTYGAPSRLSVRPGHKGLEGRVALPAEATTLADAAGMLAGLLDLETDLHPDLDPRAEVRFAVPETTWKDAADDVCRQADCFWTIHEGRLLLNPRVKSLSKRPPAGAENRRAKVRFFAPDTSSPTEGTARFNWANTIRTFDAGGDERWRLRLSWIPFGPELDVLIPTIIRCGAGGTESELLEPVRLPLEETVTRQWRGAIVELSSPPAGEDARSTSSNPSRGTDCAQGSGDEIRATFRRARADGVPGSPSDGTGAHETVLDLETRPGAYLLVTLPRRGTAEARPGTERSPEPTLAVLALGAGVEGLRVALITPTGDGSGVRVVRKTLPAGGEIRETIAAPDGHEFDLRLRSSD